MSFKKKKIRRKQILARLREEKVRKRQGDTELKKEQSITKSLKEKKEETLQVQKEAAFVEAQVETRDEINIREGPPKIADSLLMQLEEEVVGFINRRMEEHITKRIKGVLLPVAKLSLKMKKLRNKFTGEQAKYFSDLEDDLDYILENSKLKRISPEAGEKFSPALHEEVDFSWNPNRAELEILAAHRDGFLWEYNCEMILKPQVVVNRRITG